MYYGKKKKHYLAAAVIDNGMAEWNGSAAPSHRLTASAVAYPY